MSKKTLVYLILISLFSIFLSGCNVSDEEVAKLGNRAKDETIKNYGLYKNAAVTNYVQTVGRKLEKTKINTKKLKYNYYVLDSDELNAFSIPPNHIFITRGFMAVVDSEDDLAFVLGHEIGHIVGDDIKEKLYAENQTKTCTGCAGNSCMVLSIALTGDYRFSALLSSGTEGVTNIAMTASEMKFSRDQELEADTSGMKLSTAAGYNAAGAEKTLRILDDLEKIRGRNGGGWFDTHPLARDRIGNITWKTKEYLGESNSPTNPKSDITYLNTINGLKYGFDMNEPFVLEKQFFNKKAGFTWQIMNDDNPAYFVPEYYAGAYSNDNNGERVWIYSNYLEESLTRDNEMFLYSLLGKDTKIISAKPLVFKGIRAIKSLSEPFTSSNGTRYQATVISLAKEKSFFGFVIYHPENISQERKDQLIGIYLDNFNFISPGMSAAIQNRVIRHYTVARGDTWPSIIAKYNPRGINYKLINNYITEQVKFINHNRELKPGEVVKVIAEVG